MTNHNLNDTTFLSLSFFSKHIIYCQSIIMHNYNHIIVRKLGMKLKFKKVCVYFPIFLLVESEHIYFGLSYSMSFYLVLISAHATSHPHPLFLLSTWTGCAQNKVQLQNKKTSPHDYLSLFAVRCKGLRSFCSTLLLLFPSS